MAFTFTLTSFTCTVQFIGLLLVRAIQGDWLWPFIGMLFFFLIIFLMRYKTELLKIKLDNKEKDPK